MSSIIQQPKGSYLIRGGAVITVDRAIGTLPKADVLVRDGRIEKIADGIEAEGMEVIDAADMIVMPGLIDTHYHMWSTLGRNFVSDGGYEYFQAKWATAALYDADDFYRSVRLGLAELANSGVTTVHNWSHNNRSPAHVDAELKAHQGSGLRARYAMGHIDKMPVDQVNRYEDLPRVREEWFADPSRLQGLVHLGVNLRGAIQSNVEVFYQEMETMLKLGLPVAIHASQAEPNSDDAADYERRGFLGPNFLFCHYITATDSDREAMARTGTPLSFATLSELRLGETGDARRALLKMREAGISVSLSSDASSLVPPNMLESMRVTWNMGVPWQGTDTAHLAPIGLSEIIEMATINGAKALGLGSVTGSLTPGKQADIILIRANDLNTAPMANIETTVVMGATAANVDTVMVDGRILKRAGKLVDCDVAEVVGQAKRSAMRIRTAAGGILAPQCAGCAGNAVFHATAC
ncbi:amidohydrolase family protein [Mesorhizobium koreense]|jgi:cytosine/adenosine deaminase-related metal-dependent hydrolase|uniref:amidohydrolase family protein n=1 Tax=Mesorhizobium koreense TaxID=3074855 RepID=UPI00287B93AE|nr:amidohydrolase family protein [Mesorhizobium sp. WR6]